MHHSEHKLGCLELTRKSSEWTVEEISLVSYFCKIMGGIVGCIQGHLHQKEHNAALEQELEVYHTITQLAEETEMVIRK